jgi:hypothetical protein
LQKKRHFFWQLLLHFGNKKVPLVLAKTPLVVPFFKSSINSLHVSFFSRKTGSRRSRANYRFFVFSTVKKSEQLSMQHWPISRFEN